jgi:uncharacterized protein
MKTIFPALMLLLLHNLCSSGQTNKEVKMEQRISIITLGVSNLKTSTDFYTSKFGWRLLESSNENIAFFQLNGVQLALFDRNELAKDATVESTGNGFKAFSLAYNARSEKEVDDIISTLKANGVKILKNPQKVFWGGYSSYVCDPDSNIWEIAYNPYLKLDNQGNIK